MGETKRGQKNGEVFELMFISSAELERHIQKLYEEQMTLLKARRKGGQGVPREIEDETQGGNYGLN